MRKAEDTQVKLAEPYSCPNQHDGVNAEVTWFQIEDGIDEGKHLFGIHPDGDLSLYVAADEGMLFRRQMVLSKRRHWISPAASLPCTGRKCNA